MNAQQWIRIDQLFHSALTHEPAERAAFLSEACAGDDWLRSEVEALLAVDGQLNSFLEHGPKDAAMTLEPGLRVGAYQIVELIARGGMGEVYRARDTRLAREVALKVLPRLASAPPSLSGNYAEALGKAQAVKSPGAMQQRFEVEALLTASVQHPAVVPIYERGQLSDGRPFYAMKLVSGRSLRQLIDQHTTVAARMALLPNVIAVAEALAHAHSRHILHRDVKPSNIIIGEFGETVLIDWGVAKHFASGSDEPPAGGLSPSPERTALGLILGTPAYMSPEQAQGKPVDERADVFSLGATLYHLISGRAPYEGDTAAILPRVVRGDFVPLNAGQPDIPGELAAIVNKAMEREPSQRYPTARELVEDLRRFQTGKLVLSHRYSARELVVRWAERHRALLLAIVVFLFLAAVGATVGLRRIVAERDRANREAAASNRVSQFMTEMFRVSDPSEARGNNVTAREILDKASKQIEGGLSRDPTVQARLMQTMAEVYSRLGLYAKAGPLAEKAVELRTKLFGPDHRDTLYSMTSLGYIKRGQGRYPEAAEIHQRVLQIRRRVLGPEHPDTLTSMENLAVVKRRQGRYAEAEKLHRQIVDIRRRVLGPEHPDTLMSMENLAVVEMHQGRYAEAEKLHRQVFDIQRRVLGTDHPNTLVSMGNLAGVETELGKYDEAEKLYREGLDIARRVVGSDHPDTLMYMLNLAVLQTRRGKYDASAELNGQVFERSRRVLGPEHPTTLLAMHNLASNERRLEKYAEAEGLELEVLAARRRVLGAEHSDTLESMSGLGELYLAWKRFAASERILREVIEISSRVLGPKHPQTLRAMGNLAGVESAEGRQANAEKLCREVLDLQQQVLGPEDDDTLLTKVTLANIYARQARYVESEKLELETLAASQRVLGLSHPQVGLGFSRLASLALRQGDRKKALEYLRQAVDHGLSPVDLMHLQLDDELAALRGDAEFEALVKQRTSAAGVRSTHPAGNDH